MSLKINGGIFKGICLNSPSGNKTRPTSNMLREAVFNICQHKIQDAAFLDIFAGTGAMGLEALSRGAAHATFIENERNALLCIKKNIERLSVLEKTSIYPQDVLSSLKKLEGKTFDVIYIDPPYGEKEEEKRSLEKVKHILTFLDHHLTHGSSWIFLEFSSYCKEDFSKISLENLKWQHKRTFARSDLHLFKIL
jgi:16S rRNA (guanine966-N2)-methyltransferase